MTNEQLWNILNPAIATLFTTLLSFLLWRLRQWVEQNTKLSERRLIAQAIITAVMAAEQFGGLGPAKRAQAIETAQRDLANMGLHLDLISLGDLIEAELMMHFNRFREQPKDTPTPDSE